MLSDLPVDDRPADDAGEYEPDHERAQGQSAAFVLRFVLFAWWLLDADAIIAATDLVFFLGADTVIEALAGDIDLSR
jgi:hypothetical protein